MTQLWEWLKSEGGQVLLAGGAGATASAIHRWPGFFSGARQVIVGTLTAYYMSDYAAPIFKWLANLTDLPVEKASAPGAFLVGATGTFILETILRAAALKQHELREKGNSHDKHVPGSDRRD